MHNSKPLLRLAFVSYAQPLLPRPNQILRVFSTSRGNNRSNGRGVGSISGRHTVVGGGSGWRTAFLVGSCCFLGAAAGAMAAGLDEDEDLFGGASDGRP